uniref:Uncharacterized protein n=1 Tax=Picea glauca TaxID=3330 RepID=A0A101M1R3_PICGL|nr:hypothetical protein ABT39_MTgene3867 [Picea glauca]QHR86143.1 hypothetical protein Q903MT_gene142 [Picea sitchensis]
MISFCALRINDDTPLSKSPHHLANGSHSFNLPRRGRECRVDGPYDTPLFSLDQMRETRGRIVFSAFYLLRYMPVTRELISARPYFFLLRPLLLRGNSSIQGLKFRGIRQCRKGQALCVRPRMKD